MSSDSCHPLMLFTWLTAKAAMMPNNAHNLRISTSFYLLWYTGPIDKMSRGGTLDKLMMLMNDACHHPDFLFDIESPCLMLELVMILNALLCFADAWQSTPHQHPGSWISSAISNMTRIRFKILHVHLAQSGQGLNFGSWDSKKLQSRGNHSKFKGWLCRWKDDERMMKFAKINS